MNRVLQMRNIQKRALELFKKKNADYGDAFATYGAVGVIVRMGDKISRLSSISKTNITLVNDESMKDTLMDLHNYSAMALMLLEEDNQRDNMATNTNMNKKIWRPWVQTKPLTKKNNTIKTTPPTELEQINQFYERTSKYNDMVYISENINCNDNIVERAKKVLGTMNIKYDA